MRILRKTGYFFKKKKKEEEKLNSKEAFKEGEFY